MLPWIKKLTFVFIFMLLPCFAGIALAKSTPPTINAGGAILLDARTGEVLFEKNAYKHLAPASTTKIMTAIIAIESGRLDEKTTVSKNAAGTSGSSMHLETGQIITLRELLTGLLLRSGNDSAIAIAEFISGSVDDFVVLMNKKAGEIGAYNTHFRNPHGLSAPGHQSTAFDLAWLARYAMNNPVFADIVNTKNTSIDWQDSRGKESERSLKNTNKLLWMLEEADGIKTGTTTEAGPCLVSSATKDNQRLIAVTLHDVSRWQDSQQLLQWGFENFSLFEHAAAGQIMGTIRVEGGVADSFTAGLATDAAMVIDDSGQKENVIVQTNLPDKIKAPVYQGQKVGEVNFLINDKVVKSFDLLATSAVEEKTIVRLFLNQLTSLFRFFSGWGLL